MRLGFGMAAAGLALAGLGAVALAQAAPDAARPGRAERVKAMFERVDANRDGSIDKAEAEAARTAMRQRMDADRKARRDRAFARLDSDRNGQISRAEFDAAPRMAMAGEGPRSARMMRRMDRRGGGMMAFERMDADRDGRVTLAEAQSFQPRRFAMRDGRRGGGRGLPPSGHPPVAGATLAPMSDAERPLGGGRD